MTWAKYTPNKDGVWIIERKKPADVLVGEFLGSIYFVVFHRNFCSRTRADCPCESESKDPNEVYSRQLA